jgi:hypothetical protein
MKTYRFSISIHATKENIWKILWDDATYRIWAAAFHEGTHAVSDWNTGSRILFVDEKGNGAFAEIILNDPCNAMSFRHLGWTGHWQELPADLEFTIDGKVMKFSGGDETYLLTSGEDTTTLTVEMNGDYGNWEDHLNKAYPEALAKVKELSEGY